MNTVAENTYGWAEMPLRTTLNVTIYESLSIKNYIKSVNKRYIPTYFFTAEATSSDKLWLLSCGEIWDNGYNGGQTRGYSISTEGSQYKYYKVTLGSAAYNASTNVIQKPNSNPKSWWLRSPSYDNSYSFCMISSSGLGDYLNTLYDCGVAPGFSI